MTVNRFVLLKRKEKWRRNKKRKRKEEEYQIRHLSSLGKIKVQIPS